MEKYNARKMTRSEFLRLSSIGLGSLFVSPVLGVSNSDQKNTRKSDLLDTRFWENWSPEIPNRLHPLTHELAEKALGGTYGDLLVNADWDFPEGKDPALSANKKYALAARSLANNSPLRIELGELIVGAATVKESSMHRVPLLNIDSASHTTPDFRCILEIGYKGLKQQIKKRLSQVDLDEKGTDLLESMLITLEAASLWHKRYMDEINRLYHISDGSSRLFYKKLGEALQNVPENPPQTFREAVQSLWFAYAFQRLLGNWLGIGRIDVMLDPYLKADLAEKRITLDEAREIMAHFWIKGCEWITNNNTNGSGDAQFYQNIILGGIDKTGKDITSPVTYLVLDVVEELHISDFPIAVRLGRKTPDKLFQRIAEVQRRGGGIVSLYNEEVVIDGLTRFGYPLEEAREFTNDGCWETIIPGKTAFLYIPCDMTQVLSRTLNLPDTKSLAYSDFDSLYQSFLINLKKEIGQLQDSLDQAWLHANPNPALSFLVEGCIEKGRGYNERGPKYSVMGIHYGGVSDTANSFLVLKKLVFEEQFISLEKFVDILRNDWKNQESLRQLIQNRISFYGNDNAEADEMMGRIFNDYASIVGETKYRNGVYRPCGISTFGREIDWRMLRYASPEGSLKGDVLATNCSPTPGSDKKGPTSALNSYCKLDFTRMPSGATLELKLLPSSVKGKNGVNALVSLAKSFYEQKGFYLHIDVVDSAVLIDAQLHPERYRNLPVRVAGWSARFTTLSREWQNMIIQRTQHLA